jgi:hypothetical protein
MTYLTEKGKPVERRGRKVTGLKEAGFVPFPKMAGPPG